MLFFGPRKIYSGLTTEADKTSSADRQDGLTRCALCIEEVYVGEVRYSDQSALKSLIYMLSMRSVTYLGFL